jgi:Protein of unknown function (DUF3995)
MAPVAEGASRRVRVVAAILWRGLVLVAGLQAYWALGGTWAVHALSGGRYAEATTGLRIQSAVAAALLVAACVVVHARTGNWHTPLSDRVVRVAMWIVTAGLAAAAVVNFAASTSWERFAAGPVALVLALLALVVAGSGGALQRIHVHRPHPSH